MKIANKTQWLTGPIRSILCRVFQEEELSAWQRTNLNVEIRTSHPKGHCRNVDEHVSGCAWLKGTEMVLRLPPAKRVTDPTALAVIVASVAAHEVAHLRGVDHHEMHGAYKPWSEHSKARFAWAREFPMQIKLTKVIPLDERRLLRQQEKIKIAREAVTRWERKHKTAQTKLRKWRQRLQGIEKAMAAARSLGKKTTV